MLSARFFAVDRTLNSYFMIMIISSCSTSLQNDDIGEQSFIVSSPPCGTHCRWPCVTHHWHRFSFVPSWRPRCSTALI